MASNCRAAEDTGESANLAAGRQPLQPWRVPKAAEFLGVSERHLWRLIAGKKIRAIHLGRTTLIPAAEMDRILAGK